MGFIIEKLPDNIQRILLLSIPFGIYQDNRGRHYDVKYVFQSLLGFIVEIAHMKLHNFQFPFNPFWDLSWVWIGDSLTLTPPKLSIPFGIYHELIRHFSWANKYDLSIPFGIYP